MPDYIFLLESRLTPEQRAAMLRVQELAAAMGFNVYLTGGTVRDLITGATLRDMDFTVEGNPSKMARELEKGGAKVLSEDEKTRHINILFAGDVEGTLSAARDDHYVRPGTRPEIRWSTIMEDLRRRDFSLNAIAISLNPASRGLLLDPTNGLSDIEHGEIRALTIHSFTNMPVRLLSALRFAARMGFKLESRTQEWFNLAIERELQHTITPEDAGEELREVSKEERPHLVLKEWESQDLIERVHPVLAKKHPSYDAINRLIKVRDDLFMAGEADVRRLDREDAIPDAGYVDGLVVMGGPLGAYEEYRYPFLPGECRLLAETVRRGRPVLGVCLGAQLLAKALGATVFAGHEPEIGFGSVELTAAARRDPLFAAAPRAYRSSIGTATHSPSLRVQCCWLRAKSTRTRHSGSEIGHMDSSFMLNRMRTHGRRGETIYQRI